MSNTHSHKQPPGIGWDKLKRPELDFVICTRQTSVLNEQSGKEETSEQSTEEFPSRQELQELSQVKSDSKQIEFLQMLLSFYYWSHSSSPLKHFVQGWEQERV
jgi:hypothetical protein